MYYEKRNFNCRYFIVVSIYTYNIIKVCSVAICENNSANILCFDCNSHYSTLENYIL